MSLFEKCPVLTAFSNSIGDLETIRSSRLSPGKFLGKRSILWSRKLTFLLGMISLHFRFSAATKDPSSLEEKLEEALHENPSTVTRPPAPEDAIAAFPEWTKHAPDLQKYLDRLNDYEDEAPGRSDSSTVTVYRRWVEEPLRGEIVQYSMNLQREIDILDEHLNDWYFALLQQNTKPHQNEKFLRLEGALEKMKELNRATEYLLQYDADEPSPELVEVYYEEDADGLGPPPKIIRAESYHHKFGSQRLGLLQDFNREPSPPESPPMLGQGGVFSDNESNGSTSNDRFTGTSRSQGSGGASETEAIQRKRSTQRIEHDSQRSRGTIRRNPMQGLAAVVKNSKMDYLEKVATKDLDILMKSLDVYIKTLKDKLRKAKENAGSP